MIFHGEKCRHCGANMTQPKPVLEGPRKGQTRTICVKCGHIDYHGVADTQQSNPQMAQAQQPKRYY